jgi:hypothetical protein
MPDVFWAPLWLHSTPPDCPMGSLGRKDNEGQCSLKMVFPSLHGWRLSFMGVLATCLPVVQPPSLLPALFPPCPTDQ